MLEDGSGMLDCALDTARHVVTTCDTNASVVKRTAHFDVASGSCEVTFEPFIGHAIEVFVVAGHQTETFDEVLGIARSEPRIQRRDSLNVHRLTVILYDQKLVTWARRSHTTVNVPQATMSELPSSPVQLQRPCGQNCPRHVVVPRRRSPLGAVGSMER